MQEVVDLTFELVGIAATYGLGTGMFVYLLSYAVGGVLSIFKQAI